MSDNTYYIIRCKEAGVFFGHVKGRNGGEAILTDVRRIWYWNGAASLSQMAMEGVSRPRDCKFSVTVPEMTVLGVIELIPCTDGAAKSIMGVTAWRA